MTTEPTTFIYCLNDPRDGRLRYVGKADDPMRRWKAHVSASNYTGACGVWIRDLRAVGLVPELEVLEEIPMAGWQEIEKEYIRVFRMVVPGLLNILGGGQGDKQSIEVRTRKSEAMLGAKNHFFGKTHPPETRLKMGANKGRKFSTKYCDRVSRRVSGNGNPNFGKKHSGETRAKIKAARALQVFSPESQEKKRESMRQTWAGLSDLDRAKRANVNTGKKNSPETREKKRRSALRYYEAQRAQKV